MENEALKAIEGYKSNKIIMNFVKTEALEKVAAEISAKPNRICTPAAVKLLAMQHTNIAERVADYERLALIGCYMAAQ